MYCDVWVDSHLRLLRNHEVFPKEKLKNLLSRKKSIDYWFLHFLLCYVVTYHIDSQAYQYLFEGDRLCLIIVGTKYSDSHRSKRVAIKFPIENYQFYKIIFMSPADFSLGVYLLFILYFWFFLWRFLPIVILLY